MNRTDTADEAATTRAQLVADWPDVTDIDAWPDIADLPGSLLPVLELLRAEAQLASLRREPEQVRLYLASLVEVVTQARDSLIVLTSLSPLERWRMAHPERPDPLDGTSDCGSPDCPPTGFPSMAEVEVHHRRWPPLRRSRGG